MTPIGQRILLTILSLAIAAVVAAIPPIRAWLSRAFDRLRTPSPRARRFTAAIIFILSITYIFLTALQQDRDLIPKFHDEHMHLLQMRMLAHGRLWMPPLPAQVADFFESFHIFVKPVYASIYFPGTALMYLPAIWLDLPYWLAPLVVAGGCCALIYLVVGELLDRVCGILAALLLVSLQWFRYLAMMVMSHSVMLLLGLAIVWAWLGWRRNQRLGWAALIGALMGWAAITRPVDALCYSLPVGVAMLVEMRALHWKRIASTICLAGICAAPFLSLQLIENKGITGEWLKSPYRMYADRFTPQMSFGFHEFDPAIRPQTQLAQRQEYYDVFTVPAAKAHRPDLIVSTWLHERFPLIAEVDFPNRLLLVLLPFALITINERRRAMLWTVLPIYIGFYAFFAYLLPVYCVVIAPPIILLLLMGKCGVERIAGERRGAEVFVAIGIVLLCVAVLPGIDRDVIDDGFPTPTMWFSYKELPKHVQTPALVLFRFHPGDNTNEEPVYNVDVLNPDDAPIIRAHDLGAERDQELFDYYAGRQPNRNVYLFDRSSRKFERLGNVADLAGRQRRAAGPGLGQLSY